MAVVKQEPITPQKKVAPKLAKAKASPKRKGQASPKRTGQKPEKGLPAPEKNAWVDVRNQVNSLAKKGKPQLTELMSAAKEKGIQGKREFYYNVFLLDPDVPNSLLTKSTKAGLNFRHAFKNKVTKKDGVHNAARTLLRWMKKQSAWGKLYWCKIPLWD